MSAVAAVRLLVGVAEMGAPGLLARVNGLVALRGHEVLLVHVIDTGPRSELHLGRERVPRRPLPPHRERAVGEAEREAARTLLDEAAAIARRLGAETYAGTAEGEPGRVLCALAAEHGCTAVAVGARAREAAEGRPGPHSVGHTARFVLDHAPCPVLLVRG
jgi:nucleotide-binding universal stress UspA family protein